MNRRRSKLGETGTDVSTAPPESISSSGSAPKVAIALMVVAAIVTFFVVYL